MKSAEIKLKKKSDRPRGLQGLSDESGQTVIFAAVCMIFLVGFIGLAIDVGHLRYTKRQLQSMADATAIAAAREIRSCGVNVTTDINPDDKTCTYMETAAQQALSENLSGYTGTNSFTTSCALPAGDGLILALHSKPCALTKTLDPNFGKSGYVETVVSKRERTYFAGVLGISNVMISARAEATRNLSPPCIYALDPHGSSAINVTLSALFQVNCAMVDESDADDAFTSLICLLSQAKISITGGATALLALGCPNLKTGVPPPTPADPLAYLPAPPKADAQCGDPPKTQGFLLFTKTTYTNGSPTPVNVGLISGLTSQFIFNPGVYCGGINLSTSLLASFTFNPGIYILRPQGNNGGLSIIANILGGGVVVGTDDPGNVGGIMFYNEGPTISQTLGGINLDLPVLIGALHLYPPTNGEYAGVLIFQPADNTAQVNILANILGNVLSGSFGGAIYAPSAKLVYTANALTTNYNILVAKDIELTVGALATIGDNSASTSLGSPLIGDDAVLVQ